MMNHARIATATAKIDEPYIPLKNNGPINGISCNTGTLNRGILRWIKSVCPLPKIIFTENKAIAIPSMLIATPETTWSARNVIDATACIMENIAETTIAARSASHGVQAPKVSA